MADSPKKNDTETEIRRSSSSDFFFLPDTVLESDNIVMKQLRHPHTSSSCMFLFDYKHKEVFEISTFDEVHRSWLVEDKIISSGRIVLPVKFNPIFLVLPYLMKASKNIPLDHLLKDEEFPSVSDLVNFDLELSHVADRKGSPELCVWCYNEEKTLSFLKKKTSSLALVLQRRKEQIPQGLSALMKGYDEDTPLEEYMVLAHGLLSECLEESLIKKLRVHLNLPNPKEKKEENSEPAKKKLKPSQPTEVHKPLASNNNSKTPQTSKAKALAKSAVGTKSITSFFGKKK